ncbi:MAG: hypothetical protein KatS3mg119_1308 [Rhodothalassiaceae bacterium]|nr:MAG: hypothetical protein KatS3mg119_1308 [Rhodothalassiaceae bacterium]
MSSPIMKTVGFLTRLAGLVAAAAVFGGAVAAQAAAERPALAPRPVAEVADRVVRLADVVHAAPAAAAGIVVADAPAPGQEMTLPLSAVAKAAARAGLTVADAGPAQAIRVRRAGRPVAREALEGRIADLLARALGEERLAVTLAGMREIVLPADAAPAALALSLVEVDRRSRRFVARAQWPDGFGGSRETELAGRYEPLAPIPVLVRAVARGEVVRADDVTIDWLPAGRISRGLLVSMDEVAGREATRSLRPGTPLRRGDLRRPVLVEKGAPVTMRLATGAMILTARGRAMEDGARGDIVRVLNPSSRRIVEGRVVGAGLVAVEIAGVRAGVPGLAMR